MKLSLQPKLVEKLVSVPVLALPWGGGFGTNELFLDLPKVLKNAYLPRYLVENLKETLKYISFIICLIVKKYYYHYCQK
jgi:hypothetical protein